jgi:electron transport complex protein RnfB
MDANPAPALSAQLDAVLPQMQCRRCGHCGCLPYAEAIACGEPINRCPPGGDAVIAALAALTGRARVALDPAFGLQVPLTVARIDETRCIGCTLCRDACPIDAIVGAAKRMHAVLPALCSGCALCVPPCPVDCIDLAPAGRAWTGDDARGARERFEMRARRGQSRAQAAGQARRDEPGNADPDRAWRRDAVAAALLRARRRRAAQARAKAGA